MPGSSLVAHAATVPRQVLQERGKSKPKPPPDPATIPCEQGGTYCPPHYDCYPDQRKCIFNWVVDPFAPPPPPSGGCGGGGCGGGGGKGTGRIIADPTPSGVAVEDTWWY
ncbi:hypothetical protein M427DRAFT_496350 [Gonapodya prolifera JEL478]|uniref:Uncharacterized protein n=1 Tax=Gonapodya prolifera (strain JEL478) TaxID=1344416 RepID=A0A139AGE1_GONPJ|nr:hypothetical protein M427DRAFT_496350 [Gonapodya prolifera JEL478]|eukprot:KXS15866.1 hypothetical protein M427DRAFT_496350 [Gonapodya prolifera JEL478]